MNRVRAAGLGALACALLASPPANAFDSEVRADTYAQAYQIRGPAGSPVISSRRVTQTISFGLIERPRDRRGVTVLFRARLRFDADFGEACDAATDRCLAQTDRSRPDLYVPLYSQRSMDLAYAYLDVLGIGRGALDIRLGRMFQVDALGFFLFDGARTRLHIGEWATAEAIAGLETRAGFVVSDGRFERDGLIRADRASWDPSLTPFVLDRSMAPVIGVAAETGPGVPIFARMAYRRVWAAEGLSEEKLGASIDAAFTPWLRVFGDAVYSIPQQTLAVANASIEWRHRRGIRLALDFARWRPTFDLSSIWASFWSDATDLYQMRSEFQLTRGLTLIANGLARRYALGETGASTDGPAVTDRWNAGGSGALVLRAPAYQASLRGTFEGGAVGLRGGVDANAAWWVWPEFLRLDGRLSLWHVEDELRPDRAGLSFGAVVGATMRLGTIADLHADFEDDINRFVGHRFRAMAILSVRGVL